MTIQLPYRSDTSALLPSVLKGQPNGKIPAELLAPCGLRNLVMVEPAAGAMRAMVAASARDGITLSATGTWRSYDDQKALFLSRYGTEHTNGKTKSWEGRTYWQLPKVASAATPGTSNHGLGIAADLSDAPTVPIGAASLTWLANHGPSFGFWNTVQSEAWHWTYCLGDIVPSSPAPVDGKDTAETDGTISAILFPGELIQGAQGDAVRAVQSKLVAAGHEVRVDGDFGMKTKRAVVVFQTALGLTADGRVGKMTWTALGLHPV